MRAGLLVHTTAMHRLRVSWRRRTLSQTWSLGGFLTPSALTGQQGPRHDRTRQELSVRSRRRLRILIAGRLASAPGQGGASWALLQWILGFRSLGHDVLLVEPLAPSSFVRPGATLARSRQARYFRSITRQFELADRATMLIRESRETVGLDYERLARAASDCDLLVDMSGALGGEEFAERIPVRIYVDLDPAFTQLWHTTGVDVGLDGHTHYATVGQQIGVERRNPVLRQELDPCPSARRARVLAQSAAADARATHNDSQLAELRLHRIWGHILRSEGSFVPSVRGPSDVVPGSAGNCPHHLGW